MRRALRRALDAHPPTDGAFVAAGGGEDDLRADRGRLALRLVDRRASSEPAAIRIDPDRLEIPLDDVVERLDLVLEHVEDALGRGTPWRDPSIRNG